MRYEGLNKQCRPSRTHANIYLMNHNNFWYCTKCNNIIYGNGKRLTVCSYNYYYKRCIYLGLDYKSEEDIKKWSMKLKYHNV